MKHTRSFTRYLFPGITFFVEVTLLFVFMYGHSIATFPTWVRDVPILTAIGGAVGLFAVGYFISVAHHCLYWCIDRYAPGDPRGVLGRLKDAKRLILKGPDGDL